MEKSLHWTKKAFNRTIEFKNDKEEIVGDVAFKLFGREVEAVLNNKKFRFDINGFIKKEVLVSDENNSAVAKINLSFRGKAEVMLADGERYAWKRNDFFMKEWELIHDLPFTDNDPVAINYERERNFFNQKGDISILESGENTELLTLIGFFIGFYFLRRRRKAATVAAVAG
ncbi:hypothetical protein [Emticicia fontis]